METISIRVIRVLTQSYDIKSEIKEESRLLDDLGMDSFNIIEASMAIEEEFDIRIDDQRWEKVETVKDIIIVVDVLMGEK